MREPTDGANKRGVLCRVSPNHVTAVARIPHDNHDSSLVLEGGREEGVVS